MEGMALNLIFCLSFYFGGLYRTRATTDGILVHMVHDESKRHILGFRLTRIFSSSTLPSLHCTTLPMFLLHSHPPNLTSLRVQHVTLTTLLQFGPDQRIGTQPLDITLYTLLNTGANSWSVMITLEKPNDIDR